MKIEKVFWISTFKGTIGIVLGVDEITQERKGYIGMADGFNQEEDTNYIAKNGQKIMPAIVKEIVAYLDK